MDATLLTLGVLLMLVGLVGQVRAKEIEVGTKNPLARFILGLIGIAFVGLALRSEILPLLFSPTSTPTFTLTPLPQSATEVPTTGTLQTPIPSTPPNALTDAPTDTATDTPTSSPIPETPIPIGPWSARFNDDNGWKRDASYWKTIQFPDVNHDGLADVCGRGGDGIWCGLSNGSFFSSVSRWNEKFNDGDGWKSDPAY